MPPAPLIIISGPSGSGKSTVIERLLSDCEWPLRLSVSATTRPKRPGEQEEVHYHFWTPERFRQGIEAGEFLEWAEVHGNLYGTPASEVDAYLESGTGVILDIDVQGATAVRQLRPEHLSVFIEVPEGRYRERLEQRGTETEESLRIRLERAREELKHADEYHVRLVNDQLDETVSRLRSLIEERFRRGESDA